MSDHIMFRDQSHQTETHLSDGRTLTIVSMWLEGSSGMYWETVRELCDILNATAVNAENGTLIGFVCADCDSESGDPVRARGEGTENVLAFPLSEISK